MATVKVTDLSTKSYKGDVLVNDRVFFLAALFEFYPEEKERAVNLWGNLVSLLESSDNLPETFHTLTTQIIEFLSSLNLPCSVKWFNALRETVANYRMGRMYYDFLDDLLIYYHLHSCAELGITNQQQDVFDSLLHEGSVFYGGNRFHFAERFFNSSLEAANVSPPSQHNEHLPRLTIKTYNPVSETQEQFFVRATEALKQYAAQVEAFYTEKGFVQKNQPSDDSQRRDTNAWLAWKVVEKLSWRKIADRTAEFGWREYVAHTTVKEQVEKLAERLGVRLEGCAKSYVYDEVIRDRVFFLSVFFDLYPEAREEIDEINKDAQDAVIEITLSQAPNINELLDDLFTQTALKEIRLLFSYNLPYSEEWTTALEKASASQYQNDAFYEIQAQTKPHTVKGFEDAPGLEIEAYNPVIESQEQFFERVVEALRMYVSYIETVYTKEGFEKEIQPKSGTQRRDAAVWLVWRVVGGLSWRQIESKTILDGFREDIQHPSIKEAVEKLAKRLGVRLEVEAETLPQT
jgi:predicted RecB family endonuclease